MASYYSSSYFSLPYKDEETAQKMMQISFIDQHGDEIEGVVFEVLKETKRLYVGIDEQADTIGIGRWMLKAGRLNGATGNNAANVVYSCSKKCEDGFGGAVVVVYHIGQSILVIDTADIASRIEAQQAIGRDIPISTLYGPDDESMASHLHYLRTITTPVMEG
jgi:hypothetical protein